VRRPPSSHAGFREQGQRRAAVWRSCGEKAGSSGVDGAQSSGGGGRGPWQRPRADLPLPGRAELRWRPFSPSPAAAEERPACGSEEARARRDGQRGELPRRRALLRLVSVRVGRAALRAEGGALRLLPMLRLRLRIPGPLLQLDSRHRRRWASDSCPRILRRCDASYRPTRTPWRRRAGGLRWWPGREWRSREQGQKTKQAPATELQFASATGPCRLLPAALESSDPVHLLQNLGRAGAGPALVSKRVASSAGSPEPLILELLRGEQARQSRGGGARLGSSCSARLGNGGGAPARRRAPGRWGQLHGGAGGG
jgi:hypothetical protein